MHLDVRSPSRRFVTAMRAAPKLLLVLAFVPGAALLSAEPAAKGVIDSARLLAKNGKFDDAIALLKGAREKSTDLEILLEIASTYHQAKRDPEAIAALDELQGPLDAKRSEGTLSAAEKAIFARAEALLEQLFAGFKDLHAADQKAVKEYRDLIEKLKKKGQFRAARAALAQILKIDPLFPEVEKITAAIRDAENAGEGWKDLTSFEKGPKKCNDGFPPFNLTDPAQIKELDEYFSKYSLSVTKKYVMIHPLDHDQGFVTFKLAAPIKEFRATLGLLHPAGKAIFKVVADGKEVYSSGPVEGSAKPLDIQIKLRASKDLKLLVDSDGSFINDHCVWLDPKVR
jgi:tetratricopeptide (TPR) repeat protein